MSNRLRSRTSARDGEGEMNGGLRVGDDRKDREADTDRERKREKERERVRKSEKERSRSREIESECAEE